MLHSRDNPFRRISFCFAERFPCFAVVSGDLTAYTLDAVFIRGTDRNGHVTGKALTVRRLEHRDFRGGFIGSRRHSHGIAFVTFLTAAVCAAHAVSIFGACRQGAVSVGERIPSADFRNQLPCFAV